MSEEKINSQNPQPDSDWEAQLQARANEFVNQRIGSLKAEIERLQSTITDISSKLAEQATPVATEEEASGLLDYVKQWFNDSSAKAEEEFQNRLAEAREQWESTAQQSREEEFQKRLEQACAEAAAVARREAESQMDELKEQLEASRKALTLAVSSSQSSSISSSGYQQLKVAVEDIDAQRTQSDSLAALVRHAAQFAPRVVFFVVKGGDAVGWKAAGYDNGLNDETVRSLSVSTQNQTLIREALTTFARATHRSSSPGENSPVLGNYGSPVPETAVAIPLVVRGKAAAVLYADSGTQSEGAINAAALESLMHVASMGIELLPIRRGVEPVRPGGQPQQLSSSTAGLSTSSTAAAPAVDRTQPEPAVSPEPKVSEPETENQIATPPPVEPQLVKVAEQDSVEVDAEDSSTSKRITEELTLPSAEATEAGPEVSPPAEPEIEESAASEELASATTRVAEEAEEIDKVPTAEIPAVTPSSIAEAKSEIPGFEPVVPPPPPAPPFYASAGPQNDLAPAAVEEPRTSEPAVAAPAFTAPTIEPPRPAQPMMAVPTPASETEQRAHNDARRFARLLVSEIKLYNAAKVNEGRRNFDLYERLKEEIDRSRKVYDKRVSPAVATKFDYFYDELVQTLAEGDVAKLGANCPGPVMLGS
ncbi:MAG: hypothetical protein AB7P14_27325 [Blastocatellales bacterium]